MINFYETADFIGTKKGESYIIAIDSRKMIPKELKKLVLMLMVLTFQSFMAIQSVQEAVFYRIAAWIMTQTVF